MDHREIKEIFSTLGADLCGIASIDRFDDAPEGYHPLDVLPTCKSVISFACRFPVGTLFCASPVPYTQVRNAITSKMDTMALDFCILMEKAGVLAIPIPTNSSELDPKTGRYRSIISQKHAAQAAGLGTIGRHSLLITPEFGSMVWLGAVLTEAAFTPDEPKAPICTGCNFCVDACPVNALEKTELDQPACWNHAFGEEREDWRITCHRCRDICPFNLGTENAQFQRG